MPPCCCFARSRAKVDGSALDRVNYPPVTSELDAISSLRNTSCLRRAAPSARRCWLGLFSHGGGRGCGNASDHGRGPCRGRGHGRSRRGGDHNRGHCAHRRTQVQLSRPTLEQTSGDASEAECRTDRHGGRSHGRHGGRSRDRSRGPAQKSEEDELWREASSPEARVSSPEVWGVRGRSRRRGRSLRRGALAVFVGGK